MATDRAELALDPLIGRDGDLIALLDVVDRSRLVTLTGTGGSGKTRLALAVVIAVRETGGEAHFVACSAIQDADHIGAAIRAVLDVDGAPGLDPIDDVARTLRGRRTVVVLDNLEQIEGALAVVLRLLDALPQLTIVGTSRRPLGSTVEMEFAVAPLRLPAEATVADVTSSAAGQLFLRRAEALTSIAALDDTGAVDIAALLHRLDGLPLAIELAAARTRSMTVREINERLDALGPTSIDVRDGDAHHSLRAVLDWTIGRLSTAESETLDAVSVCAGFDLDFVRSLVPGLDVINAVESLIALGLVHRDGSRPGATRFRLLETVRTTVQLQMSADLRNDLRDRHAARVLEIATEWERLGEHGPGPELLAWFATDADNVRLALDHLETVDPRQAIVLLARLGQFWALHGRPAEAYARFRRARVAIQEPSPELVRAALHLRSEAFISIPAREFHELADWTVATARTVGDEQLLIEALIHRAYVAYNGSDHATLAAIADEVESLSSEADQRGRRAEIRAIVSAATEGRTSDRHIEFARAYLAELEALGDVLRQAGCEGNLAGSLLGRREFAESARFARHAIATYQRLDRSADAAWALAFLAPALAGMGKAAEARDAILECASIAVEVRHAEIVASALWAAIPVALAFDQIELGARLWGALVPGMEARGEVVLNQLDRDLANDWMRQVRRQGPALVIELAVRDGERADPIQVLGSLPAGLSGTALRTVTGSSLRHGRLTKREVEVLELVGRGRSDQEIADSLFISAKTASVHVSNVKGKLGVDSRLEIALRARDLGLVEPT